MGFCNIPQFKAIATLQSCALMAIYHHIKEKQISVFSSILHSRSLSLIHSLKSVLSWLNAVVL